MRAKDRYEGKPTNPIHKKIIKLKSFQNFKKIIDIHYYCKKKNDRNTETLKLMLKWEEAG